MLCKDIRRRSSNDRLVWASGTNITVTGVPDRGRRYLSDFYTTLIDVQWRWNLLFFVVCFVFTWLAFACFYFLLCVLHGDLDPGHVDSENWKPCVVNIRSFTSAYLFSIETMSTIGYGSRHQTEECPGVYLAVMLQSVIGAGLQFALASLVVSKTRRAKRRSQTILFSDTAVTFREDHKLKLAVRIGDMRKGDVIGAHATGMLIKKTTGKQGQKVPVRMFTVPFDAEGGREKLFLCWPSLLVHVVDEHSPLWSLSRDDLLNKMYELIVILDGIAATTSKPFQARKSYHSWEILWGHRFLPLDLAEDTAGYVVNYQTFHDTYPVPIHLCSAMEVERALFLEELSQQESLLSSEDLDTDEEVEDWKDSEEDEEAAVERAEVEEEEEEDEEGEVRKDRGDENVVAKPEEGTEVTEEMANDAEDKKTEKGCLAVDDGKTDDQESGQRRISLGDALNMYRHRRSVTDTYLGTEIGDDSDNSEESAAILSIVSQQSREKRPDVRDVFKLRRKSVTQELMFGPKPDADVEKESGSDTRQRKLSQTQTPQRR
nr:hypothetical protein BaRGS_000385 [Batillaria attramentaria]